MCSDARGERRQRSSPGGKFYEYYSKLILCGILLGQKNKRWVVKAISCETALTVAWVKGLDAPNSNLNTDKGEMRT